MKFLKKDLIKIGTDCSGIEAPIQALDNIQKKIEHKIYEHEFSCDYDKYCRDSIAANYTPKIIYNNIKEKRSLEKVDVYVCGFPCQPFSTAGNQLGNKDSRNIFSYCIKAIKDCNPTLFILENVKGILMIILQILYLF